jgi:hypothetical protein
MQRWDAVLRAMIDHPISQRRACALVGVDPKTVRREHAPDNPEIRLMFRGTAVNFHGAARSGPLGLHLLATY